MSVCSHCNGCNMFYGRIIPGIGMIHECAENCEWAYRERCAQLSRKLEAEARAKEEAVKAEIRRLQNNNWKLVTGDLRHSSIGWKVEICTEDGELIARHSKGEVVVICKGGILPPEKLEATIS